MHNFRNLQIWQQGIELATRIYKIESFFPAHEKYGMWSQMSRAAVSVPSNIAEGAGRQSNREFSRFLDIALGSLYELETQLHITGEVGYLPQNELQDILHNVLELQRKISSFNQQLNNNN